MNRNSALIAVLALGQTACATMPAQGTSASEIGALRLAGTASFDHGCPSGNVRVIRADAAFVNEATTVDLDVCGAVRRYKVFRASGGNLLSQAWVDVTVLYPASTLPAPLPPAAR